MTERRARENILAIKERMEKMIDLGRKKKKNRDHVKPAA